MESLRNVAVAFITLRSLPFHVDMIFGRISQRDRPGALFGKCEALRGRCRLQSRVETAMQADRCPSAIYNHIENDWFQIQRAPSHMPAVAQYAAYSLVDSWTAEAARHLNGRGLRNPHALTIHGDGRTSVAVKDRIVMVRQIRRQLNAIRS